MTEVDGTKKKGTYCPGCGTDYTDGESPTYKKLGRPYLLKNDLNLVVKCLKCGHLHSWDLD